jgi:hypothetical protein
MEATLHCVLRVTARKSKKIRELFQGAPDYKAAWCNWREALHAS